MRILFSLAVLLAMSSTAFAAATPWQDVAPGARLRLISSDTRAPDGTTLVGIELDIPQSYKTYWRLPGEAGIAAQLDITGSTGLADPTVEWPYPRPELSNGYLDYVYHGETVLPVELRTTGTPAILKASITMGVCSDVCVPVRANFALPMSFDTPDEGQSIRLQQALALVPVPWNGPKPPFGPVSYDAKARALHIELADPAVDPRSVIPSTVDPTVIFDAPQKSRDGHSIVLVMRDADRGTDWTSHPVQLTFMTAMGSFEVSEQVGAHRQ